MKKEELKSLVEEITLLEQELSESLEIPVDEIDEVDGCNETANVEELQEATQTQFDRFLKDVSIAESAKLNKKLVEGIEPNRRYNQLYREKSLNRIKF